MGDMREEGGPGCLPVSLRRSLFSLSSLAWPVLLGLQDSRQAAPYSYYMARGWPPEHYGVGDPRRSAF